MTLQELMLAFDDFTDLVGARVIHKTNDPVKLATLDELHVELDAGRFLYARLLAVEILESEA